MDPGTMMQGIGMVAGWIGSAGAKSRESKKIGRLKGITSAFQSEYIGAAGNIDKKYKKLGSMQYEGNQLQGLMNLNEYKAGKNQFDNSIGRADFADIGGEESLQMENAFDLLTDKTLLANKASAFDLQESANSEFRGVKMGLLGLREKAANAGFRANKSSFDLNSYLNRGYAS